MIESNEKMSARAVPEVGSRIETDATNRRIRNDLLPNDSNAISHRNRLSVNFFIDRSCEELAIGLLGKILCRRLPDGTVLRGRIVETEAYLGERDKASHSRFGRRTKRNEPMFMESGTCYVCLTWGVHHSFSISSEGLGAAVMIRAIQPLNQIDEMQRLRTSNEKRIYKTLMKRNHSQYCMKKLTNGPSKLCMAFQIDKNLNKVNITDTSQTEIWLEDSNPVDLNQIQKTRRIGINPRIAKGWARRRLRFLIKKCEFASPYR